MFYEGLKSLPSFSRQSSLQTWLFSIAQNLLKSIIARKNINRI
ncbi:hypothetical protein ACI2OX_20850 [Bacillus sp. N9]